MPRPIAEIIAHIRAVCDNASVDATLIQTEDLYVLCDAAERSDRPRDDGTVVAVGGEPGANAGKSE